MNPRVTIVLPCHNMERFVAEALRSIAAQSLTEWECIVVDDGSTDGSAQRIRESIAGDPRFRLHCQENRGVNAASNTGRALACPSSRYVYFPNSDDRLAPALLETCIGWLDAHPDEPAVAFDQLVFHETPGALPTWPKRRHELCCLLPREAPYEVDRMPFETLYAFGPPSEPCVVLTLEAFDRWGGWPTNGIRHGMNIVLFGPLALERGIPWLNLPLYEYRWHGANNSIAWGRDYQENCRRLDLWFEEHVRRHPAHRSGFRRGLRLRTALELKVPLRMALGALRRGRVAEAWKLVRDNRSLIARWLRGSRSATP